MMNCSENTRIATQKAKKNRWFRRMFTVALLVGLAIGFLLGAFTVLMLECSAEEPNQEPWIRKRFFGEITGKDAQGNPVYKFHDSWISPDGQIFATTTNYLCNEWLDEADLKVFQTMKETNPRRYKVAGLGGWGIVDGLIFENWREEAFNVKEVSAKVGVKSAFGLDFGYTNDPTALFCGLVSKEEKTIWVFDELYEKALTNRAICNRITAMGYAKERIKADCAEPKSIDELREAGLHRIRAARKGKDSVNNCIRIWELNRLKLWKRWIPALALFANPLMER